MSNTTWTGARTSSNSSNFLAWGKAISDALAAIGMVREDYSTYANTWLTAIPGYTNTANTEWNWEIWRFPNSAEQTAAPIFIRVGYGTGSSTSGPLITFKLASAMGTIGTGVVTGIGGSGVISGGAAILSTTTVGTSMAASDGHGLVLALNYDNAAGATAREWVVIDRHRDIDGTPLTTGIALYRSLSGSSVSVNHFDLVQSEYATMAGIAPCVTTGALSTTTPHLNASLEAQLYPWWSVTKNSHGVSKMIATYALPDLIAGADQAVRWLPALTPSTTRTVRALGATITGQFDQGPSAGGAIAMWWSD